MESIGRLTEGQAKQIHDLQDAISAVNVLGHAALGVPMTGPIVIYPMCVEVSVPQEERESSLAASTLPLALRLAREVVTAAEGLREKIARVEAIVQTMPEFSELR